MPRPRPRPVRGSAIVAFAVLLACVPARAQFPTGLAFTPVFATDGANKVTWPTAMEEIPGEPGSFLVLEKNSGTDPSRARIWRFVPGSGLPMIKIEFASLAVHSENASNAELGLLGLAFHPRFRETRKYYVDYNPGPREHAVEEREFTADFTGDAGIARRILTLPANSGHNGGSLAFGPDGFLYVSVGDAADPRNGQSRATLNGKILRIDVDNPPGGRAYGIPADNPFQEAGQRGEIYAFGFRNPWRLAFDPVGGALFVGDVGLSSFEEVNRVAKGGNYGWDAFEGTLSRSACAAAPCLPPAAAYGRAHGRAIVGGQVYRGERASRFYGAYLFADYAYNGPVFAMPADGPPGSHVQVGELGKAISAVARDSRNNLYVLGHDTGIIYRLTHADLPAAETPARLLPTRPGAAGRRPARLRVDLRSGRVWMDGLQNPPTAVDGRLGRP